MCWLAVCPGLIGCWAPLSDGGLPEPAGAAQGAGEPVGERGGRCSLPGPAPGQSLHHLLEPGLVLPAPGPAQQPAAAHPLLAAGVPAQPGNTPRLLFNWPKGSVCLCVRASSVR